MRSVEETAAESQTAKPRAAVVPERFTTDDLPLFQGVRS